VLQRWWGEQDRVRPSASVRSQRDQVRAAWRELGTSVRYKYIYTERVCMLMVCSSSSLRLDVCLSYAKAGTPYEGVRGGRCDGDGGRTNRGLCCVSGVSACTRLKTCLLGLHSARHLQSRSLLLVLGAKTELQSCNHGCSDVATSSPSISLSAYYKHGKQATRQAVTATTRILRYEVRNGCKRESARLHSA
jgi:hypothetical protein